MRPVNILIQEKARLTVGNINIGIIFSFAYLPNYMPLFPLKPTQYTHTNFDRLIDMPWPQIHIHLLYNHGVVLTYQHIRFSSDYREQGRENLHLPICSHFSLNHCAPIPNLPVNKKIILVITKRQISCPAMGALVLWPTQSWYDNGTK